MRCTLICRSSAQHLQQLYAGFGLLAKRKRVAIDVQRGPDYTGSHLGPPLLTAILEGGIHITYDAGDSESFNEEDLASSHVYFKRSYNESIIRNHSDRNKIFPLGFNYPVYGPNDYTGRRVVWSLGTSHFIPLMVRSNYFLSRFLRIRSGRAFCRVSDLEGKPSRANNTRILFLTRVWPPGGQNFPPENVQERYEINDMRAECIRSLRREFGSEFVGGLQPNSYALEAFPDCVVRDKRMTQKENYLQLVRESSICISTTGLLRTNPWKLAEYVAGAKAVVSERLWHDVPGPFVPGVNYLEFGDPADCVEKVTRLVENPEMRQQMMKANQDYYQSYLRPDVLVQNSLELAREQAMPEASASRAVRPAAIGST